MGFASLWVSDGGVRYIGGLANWREWMTGVDEMFVFKRLGYVEKAGYRGCVPMRLV